MKMSQSGNRIFALRREKFPWKVFFEVPIDPSMTAIAGILWDFPDLQGLQLGHLGMQRKRARCSALSSNSFG
jgi:hypothetical protein